MPLYNPISAANVSGLGTAALKNTGTSGDAVPILNAAAATFGTPSAGGGTTQLVVDGGGGTNGGPYFRFNKNAVTVGYVGVDSALNGGTSNDMVIYSTSQVVVSRGTFQPSTDDAYYLGRNSATTPKAWKGLILKDQTTGSYYRVQADAGILTLTAL